VGSIVTVAILLRVFHLNYLSLWVDELFSRYYYDLFGPLYMVTQGLSVEPTPPLYYFVLEIWMSMFGHSAAAMRSLSVVASIIALPLVYAVAQELSTRTVALVAIALFAVSPMAVFFSQEARVYMLTLIPTSLMLLGISRYLRCPRGADLGLYGVGAVIGLYSHATLAFMVAACNFVVVGYLLFTASAERTTALRDWIVTNVVVGILAVPLIYSMLTIGTHGTGLSWIAPLSLHDLIISMTALVAGMITPPEVPGAELTALVLLAAGAAIVLGKMPRRPLAILIGVPAVFMMLVLVASLKQPILLPRILCWMTLPLCVTLAYATVAPSRARVAARATVLLTFAVGLYYQLALADGAKPPFREMFAQARPNLAQADEIVIGPWTPPLPLTYYAPGLTNVRKWMDPSASGIEVKELPERLGIPKIDLQQVQTDIRSGKVVWLFTSSPDERFLPQWLNSVPSPDRSYKPACPALARYNGKKAFFCIAMYGWNVNHPSSQ
jgi:uncharacterized membrane protein